MYLYMSVYVWLQLKINSLLHPCLCNNRFIRTKPEDRRPKGAARIICYCTHRGVITYTCTQINLYQTLQNSNPQIHKNVMFKLSLLCAHVSSRVEHLVLSVYICVHTCMYVCDHNISVCILLPSQSAAFFQDLYVVKDAGCN